MTHKRLPGRPPSGVRAGEKVKDYPQLSVRVPPETKARLTGLSLVCKMPQWRVIDEAIEIYLARLSASERKAVNAFVRTPRPTE